MINFKLLAVILGSVYLVKIITNRQKYRKEAINNSAASFFSLVDTVVEIWLWCSYNVPGGEPPTKVGGSY